jgi:putative phosphoribosyl transferase
MCRGVTNTEGEMRFDAFHCEAGFARWALSSRSPPFRARVGFSNGTIKKYVFPRMDVTQGGDYPLPMIYPTRRTAGRELAARLAEYAERNDTIVLALPRGGVPVAVEIAQALHAPLDVLVVRKLGLPWQPELAAGAIAPGGVIVMNPEIQAGVEDLDRLMAPVIKRERAELQRRETLYRKDQPPLQVCDKIAIIVDDGIATGATMQAAVLALRALHARSVIIAVPVAPPDTVRRLGQLADRIVCLQQPISFSSVGQWYEEFPQVSDGEVIALLRPSAAARTASSANGDRR